MTLENGIYAFKQKHNSFCKSASEKRKQFEKREIDRRFNRQIYTDTVRGTEWSASDSCKTVMTRNPRFIILKIL